MQKHRRYLLITLIACFAHATFNFLLTPYGPDRFPQYVGAFCAGVTFSQPLLMAGLAVFGPFAIPYRLAGGFLGTAMLGAVAFRQSHYDPPVYANFLIIALPGGLILFAARSLFRLRLTTSGGAACQVPGANQFSVRSLLIVLLALSVLFAMLRYAATPLRDQSVSSSMHYILLPETKCCLAPALLGIAILLRNWRNSLLVAALSLAAALTIDPGTPSRLASFAFMAGINVSVSLVVFPLRWYGFALARERRSTAAA